MKKSRYLILNSFYFDFNDDLTEITNVKELFKKQNILDIQRFEKIKYIIQFSFFKQNINFIYFPQNIKEVRWDSLENNFVKYVNFFNCKKINYIRNNSFKNNQIKFMYLSNCKNLKEINFGAFLNNPLKRIKISNNVLIECFYENDLWNKFIICYKKNKKKAGDYKYINNEWKWYPLQKINK